MKNEKAITLISLVITIIILIILAGVAINLSLGNNGIFIRAKQAKEVTNKQEATEIINLKIITAQMNKYAEKQEMPNLQELADILYEDDEIQYVALESKVADKEKVTVGNKTSIFTKLNKYPYEFEINGSLQLASINGEKSISNASNNIDYSDSKNEIVFTQEVTATTGWHDNIEGPELLQGTWLIFAEISAVDDEEKHITALGCTGCTVNIVSSVTGGVNSTSGYYKGEKTNLIVRIYNDSVTTKVYNLTIRALKLSNTY